MAFAQRLDLRQGQQLVMTPQLQQAIKMLQMSNLELRDFISEELERNPILEVASSDSSGEDTGGAEAERPAERLEQILSDDRLGRTEDTFDTGNENLYADEAHADRQDRAEHAPAAALDGPQGADSGNWSTVGKGGASNFEDVEQSLENTLSSDLTLREHLLAQLGTATSDPIVHFLAGELIEHIDEAGYLRANLAEIAERLGAKPAAMEQAVALVHRLEPTGIGARSLGECLALQLAERNRFDPAMQVLVDNLAMLAGREYAKLSKLCGVDMDDLREMIHEIRALDPKPGSQFDHDVTQTVVPDVFVYENRFGGWNIELNTDTLPRLIVNNSYAAQVLRTANGSGDEVREYISECQQTASWLMKSIDQRAKTILRVASEIVRQQDGFLAFGISALRPLNLKAVADRIEMHESTVSRVTSNKYIATPRGVFELKYFFTPAIASTDGQNTYSAEAIRHLIKSLIDKEESTDILSDDRIVAILREQGIDIARRTVAKYRDALKLPSSVQRRKEKSSLVSM
ncbi:MAG: RNA polymerase factor sigma-54 [Neomegalonema sp.]|nr:RNA polymerase factor sigma-54 [Neomegalonema sp.]